MYISPIVFKILCILWRFYNRHCIFSEQFIKLEYWYNLHISLPSSYEICKVVNSLIWISRKRKCLYYNQLSVRAYVRSGMQLSNKQLTWTNKTLRYNIINNVFIPLMITNHDWPMIYAANTVPVLEYNEYIDAVLKDNIYQEENKSAWLVQVQQQWSSSLQTRPFAVMQQTHIA